MSQALAAAEFDLDELVEHLVTEDDEPLDNALQEKQQRLLTEPLYSSWSPPPDEDAPHKPRVFWAAANLGVYPSVHMKPLVPDVFVSLDVEAPEDPMQQSKRSYLVWEHGKPPDVVIEIVSNRKGGELKHKLKDYAHMGVTYYVVYDPKRQLSDDVLRVYEPGFGKRYRLRADYELPLVGLSLTLWEGTYEKRKYTWLRWCDVRGKLIPTGLEGRLKAEAKLRKETQTRKQAEDRATHAEDRAAHAEDRAAHAEVARQTEAEARRLAEAEAARLREEIERLQAGK